MSESEGRASFSGKIGFILATSASEVGLGNLWRFPYETSHYGGGIFVLIYVILAFTFGISRLTFGYLDSRLKRVPIDQRQAYANRILANDRTPQVNRDTMVAYIQSHERMFTPHEYLEEPGWEEYNGLARVRNGPDADPGFVEKIRRAFGCC